MCPRNFPQDFFKWIIVDIVKVWGDTYYLRLTIPDQNKAQEHHGRAAVKMHPNGRGMGMLCKTLHLPASSLAFPVGDFHVAQSYPGGISGVSSKASNLNKPL